MSIYTTISTTKDAVDPFKNGFIQQLKQPLEEYMSLFDARVESLRAHCNSNLLEAWMFAVPSGGMSQLNSSIRFYEIASYERLATKFNHYLKICNSSSKLQKKEVLLLLEYEIRYLKYHLPNAASGQIFDQVVDNTVLILLWVISLHH